MIILVFGAQGSGKTLFLTKCAYGSVSKGEKVYSNYKLGFDHEQLNFEEMMKCQYNNATIIVDEAHLWGLDARSSHSKLNRDLVRQFVVQVRKQGVNLICSSQRFRQLDVRLRENADVIVMCRKYAYINNKWENVVQSQNYDKNVPIWIETDFTHLDLDKSNVSGFLANDFYHLYDTREVIKIVKEGDVYGKDKKEVKKKDKEKVITEKQAKVQEWES